MKTKDTPSIHAPQSLPPLIVTVANEAAVPLVEEFLRPSLAAHAPGCEFRLVEIEGDPGEKKFGTREARRLYVEIARQVLALHEDPANDGRLILSLGADTQLLAPVDFEAVLGEADLLTMHDVYTPLCGCVLGMRAGEKAAAYYRESIAREPRHPHMQFAQTEAAGSMRLKIARIPDAWTTGYQHHHEWKFDRPLELPAKVTLHHANFVVGMANKRRILTLVREAMAGRVPE